MSVSVGLSLFLLVKFWPSYNENEIPVFTDLITVIFVLPAYFVLIYGGVSQLVVAFVKNRAVKTVLLLLLFSAGYLFSLTVLEFSLGIRIILSTIAASLG